MLGDLYRKERDRNATLLSKMRALKGNIEASQYASSLGRVAMGDVSPIVIELSLLRVGALECKVCKVAAFCGILWDILEVRGKRL